MSNGRFLTFIALLTATTLLAAPVAHAATWPAGARKVVVPTVRVAGPDRFSTASAIAAKTYPGWTGVTRVIVASGDDRAAADPLASASLCWAYDAPLLLTARGSTPAATRAALAAIVSANTTVTVTVTVVGGPGSVPAARVAELKRIVGAKGRVEQPFRAGDRYAVARDIATRVGAVARDTSRTVPAAVFIANGADRDKFWDVLAVSAVSRHTGIPILLTAATTLPAATRSSLAAMPAARRIVIGGTGTVSPRVYTAVRGSARWSGANRYSTANDIATRATAAGWANRSIFAIAVAMPDAVTGAGLVGRAGGVLLLSTRERVHRTTWNLLSDPAAPATTGYLLGGTGSASPALLAELNGAPATPVLGASTPAARSGSTMRVAGTVGGNATSVALVVSGVTRATKAVLPWAAFSFGSMAVPTGGAKVTVVAANAEGKTASASRAVNLSRFVVCIDPGHQARANNTPEPIGPGATQTKPSVSSGATGVSTRIPEYKTTLQIALNLRKRLQAAGITVVMVRTTSDVDIPNSKRAAIANRAGADLFVRIHCDGSTSSSARGISTLYPAANQWTRPIAPESGKAAVALQKALIAKTGAVNRGAVQRSDLAGFNWATVPSVLVETGFLSNAAEDKLLNSTAYQDKVAEGMSQGIRAYLNAKVR